jgi:FAD/FMN-containing dehydrogenase
MRKELITSIQKATKADVFTDQHIRKYFSTDGSIFTQTPEAVVYPTSTQDVSEVVKILDAEARSKRKTIGITARGKGTDQSGGALGEGVSLVFPAHMNHIKEVDRNLVTVQPGVHYASLQRVLHSHGRFMPPYPSSINFSSIGGAIANNACGEKTIKYGSTREYVKSLKVVLSDGQIITTKRLNAVGLQRKKQQQTLEGKIYRDLDSLLKKHHQLIGRMQPHTSKNAAGYDLWDIRGKYGSFDLTPLLVGSQGTLGIVTEAQLSVPHYNPHTTLLVGYFDDLEHMEAACQKLLKLEPSALEFVDSHLLDFLQKNHPGMIRGLIPKPTPKIVLLCEFDNHSSVLRQTKAHRAIRILEQYARSHRMSVKKDEQQQLWRIRHSAAAVIWMDKGKQKALPIIEDGVVPLSRMKDFLEGTYTLLKKYKLEIAVWGHAGDANLHLQPFMDLSKASDRTKVIKLADEFHRMVIDLGGSTCAEHNDGLSRAPYLKELYGEDIYNLFVEVKKIFDPHNIMNPGKKIGVTTDQTKKLLRHEYGMEHLYDHMPHS